MPKSSVVTCDTCLYFKKRRLHEKVCADLGVLSFQKPCVSYEIDYTSLRTSVGSENFSVSLIALINRIPERNLEIIAEMLLSRKRVAIQSDFELFQPVYFRYQGSGSYLSHFCKAYVIDATKMEVRVINKGGTVIASIPNKSTKTGNTLLTVNEFKEVKSRLIKQRRLIDPKQDLISSASASTIIPCLDTVHREKVANFETKRAKFGKVLNPEKPSKRGHNK